MHFGFTHLLPKTFISVMPNGVLRDLAEIEELVSDKNGRSPHDVDLLVLHLERGSEEDFEIKYEELTPQSVGKRR
jgi:hypothetical protein